ncbi:hypothetical protein [Paraburkholderia sp. SIMBA_027]|uniref:hypothetical protein n=1 Tax=Paraburkholderia sp. SIMBA_027 TaxID=3085770 RepID=UPI00397E7D4F
MKIFTHVLLALRAVRPVAAGIARALREDPQTFKFGRARGQAFTWATHCSGVWAVMHFPPPARGVLPVIRVVNREGRPTVVLSKLETLLIALAWPETWEPRRDTGKQFDPDATGVQYRLTGLRES